MSLSRSDPMVRFGKEIKEYKSFKVEDTLWTACRMSHIALHPSSHNDSMMYNPQSKSRSAVQHAALSAIHFITVKMRFELTQQPLQRR